MNNTLSMVNAPVISTECTTSCMYGVWQDDKFMGVALFNNKDEADEYRLNLMKDEYHIYKFIRLN